MGTMANKTLRELAKSYAAGEIHRETYRKQRASLLSGILKGEVILQENEYPPPVIPRQAEALDATERKSERKPQPWIQGSDSAPDRPIDLTWIISGGVVIIAIAAAIIIFILFNGDDTETVTIDTATVDMQEQSLIAEPLPVIPATPTAEILLQEFLNTNNWSAASINNLIRDWSALTVSEQDSTRDSVVINQMVNAIHRQLLEERALSGLTDSQETTGKQRLLVSLARQLGIEDQRISVQEAEQPVTDNMPVRQAPLPLAEATIETSLEDSSTAADEASVIRAGMEVPGTEDPVVATAVETIRPTVAQAELPAEATPAETTDQQSDRSASMTAPAVTTTGSRNTSTSACNPSLLNSRRPYCRDKLAGIGDGPTMVAVPAGSFLMGGEEEEEKPAHEVTIDYPFAISVHEITFGEFQQYCADTGRECPRQPWLGKDFPVVNVTWEEAAAYTAWMSEKTGQVYRLPSEAEWEYAARAGTSTLYPFGDEIDISFAVFSYQNKLSSPLPKTDRSINRNGFRLYHIIGNVREWVADTWTENYQDAPADGSTRTDGRDSVRVVRGGSYADTARDLRSGARMQLPAGANDNYTGFRVIQEM
jgi:formylglycine-generating enzyme required for sulfatase activity